MGFSFRSKKNPQPVKKRSLARRIWRFTWKSVMWFFIITIVWTLAYRWINPPTTYLQLRESCNCPEGSPFQKEWVHAEEISLYMKLAVVASEDNNFMKHDGFDWGAIEKARKHNEKSKKKRGASTISQQVAKNVFLWPARSWIRKGFEVYFTFLLEFFWPKERVMEVYLNVIEMGPCIFGVEAAATTYFGKHASQLTRDEAALIAGALPNPKKMNPGKPGAYLQKRRAQITKLMRLIGENYFERYSSDWPEEKRVKEEKEVEEKLQSVPESERPQTEEAEEADSSPDSPEETPSEEIPAEPAAADTLSP
jgi:monofunctional biosynthetic peptidoglycan transglycosylase